MSFKKLNNSVLRLWSASIISEIGSAISITGVMAKAYHISESSGDVSIVMIAQALPVFLFGFAGGVFADRFHRKKVMIFADLYCMIISCLFVFADSIAKTAFLAALLIIGVMFSRPAREASVPDLADRELLAEANSLFGINRGFSFFAGSALAGIIISTFSVDVCFFVNSFSFLLSAVIISTIGGGNFSYSGEGGPKKAMSSELGITGNAIAGNKVLMAALFMTSFFMFEISLVNPLMPELTEKFFRRPPDEFGFILSALGLGGIAGSFILPWIAKMAGPRVIIIAASLLHGLFMTAIVLIPDFHSALFLILLIGFLGMQVTVSSQIILQSEGKSGDRGKIMATSMAISAFMMIIGYFTGGWIGDTFGPEKAWLISGLLGIVHSCAGAFLLRDELFGRDEVLLRPEADDF